MSIGMRVGTREDQGTERPAERMGTADTFAQRREDKRRGLSADRQHRVTLRISADLDLAFLKRWPHKIDRQVSVGDPRGKSEMRFAVVTAFEPRRAWT